MPASKTHIPKRFDDRSFPFEYSLDSLESRLESIEIKLNVLLERPGPVGKEVLALHNKLEPIRDRLDTLRDDSYDLDVESAAYERKSLAFEKKLDALEQKIDAFEEKLDALMKQADDAVTAIRPTSLYERIQWQSDGVHYRNKELLSVVVYLPALLLTALLGWFVAGIAIDTFGMDASDWPIGLVMGWFVGKCWWEAHETIDGWCYAILTRIWPRQTVPPSPSP